MKKLLVVAVVVAVALVGANVAMAGISGTKHDLSSGAGQAVRSTDQTELCVFCHTPHAANMGVPAPLWNRTASLDTFTPYYNSSTINYTPGAPGAVSLACLSCHDGAVDEALVNPNGIGANPPTMTGAFTNGDLTDGANALSNDHPVGTAVNMSAINAADGGGIYATPGNANVRLFNGAVECGSCHKVHDNTNAPFLAMSNAGSSMCLTCHNK